jgi:hypothetical protein
MRCCVWCNEHRSPSVFGRRPWALDLRKRNGSRRDLRRGADLIAAAGMQLERALVPVLTGIEHFGPANVVEVAGGVNRDHTTVGRQLALRRYGDVAPSSSIRRARRSASCPG